VERVACHGPAQNSSRVSGSSAVLTSTSDHSGFSTFQTPAAQNSKIGTAEWKNKTSPVQPGAWCCCDCPSTADGRRLQRQQASTPAGSHAGGSRAAVACCIAVQHVMESIYPFAVTQNRASFSCELMDDRPKWLSAFTFSRSCSCFDRHQPSPPSQPVSLSSISQQLSSSAGPPPALLARLSHFSHPPQAVTETLV
jgi:hypothetical protein